MNFEIKKLGLITIIAGLTLSMSSCVVVRGEPTQRKSTPVLIFKHKKPHPHGGPPGQTKKGKGHPGKGHSGKKHH
jgi:hypothetical protein